MGKRDFLRLADLSLAEAAEILTLARALKAAPKGSHVDRLRGRSVALVLEKASTRTRVSFEVGIGQLGAQPVILTTIGSQLGRGEPIRDTARVLSRYCDTIAYRTSTATRLHEMARAASVPVINALSDDGHPVQVLCDVLTIEEQLGAPITGMRVAWVGDGSSNMARSFIEAAVLFDFHLTIAAPPDYRPPQAEVEAASAHVSLYDHPRDAIALADVINTDVWTSMGQEEESEKRLEAFGGWTLTTPLLAGAAKRAIVLHCLPAHRGEEIDDETIEGPRSRVWDQAENRLHVQKALMCWLIERSS